jgi:hypothetical protein
MNSPIRILKLEIESDEGLIVTFSDGTVREFAVRELLDLRSQREPVKTSPHVGREESIRASLGA